MSNFVTYTLQFDINMQQQLKVKHHFIYFLAQINTEIKLCYLLFDYILYKYVYVLNINLNEKLNTNYGKSFINKTYSTTIQV